MLMLSFSAATYHGAGSFSSCARRGPSISQIIPNFSVVSPRFCGCEHSWSVP